MSYYTTKQIYPWLYSIKDPDNVFCYLAIGNNGALLYDTAFGIGSLPDTIREVTDKPVTVVLGHGHIDHANGAYQFKEVWLHEGDFELLREHTSEGYRRNYADGLIAAGVVLSEGFDAETYAKAGTKQNIKQLEIGRVFDLGGLTLETVAMEGHTAGSIGLLEREHRVLLASDAANPHIWMFLKESLLISQYIAMLERVKKLDFDVFFVGHSDQPMPKSEFDKFIRVAQNATVEKSTPYKEIPELKGFLYQEGDTGIVFSEDKLYQ